MPEPIWLRPESAGVGRPAEHSRAEITAAAVAIAEKDGFGKVSMRSVAAALGTGAASLYRYVGSRAELVELMIDRTYGELPLRRTGEGWCADVVGVGLEGYHLAVGHPWLVDGQLAVPFSSGPNMARIAEHYLSVLAEHPAPYGKKMEVIGMVGGVVQQWARLVTTQDIARLMATQAVFLQHIAADGHHPQIAAMVASQQTSPVGVEDPAVTLERTLTTVVKGALGQPEGSSGVSP